MIRKIPFIGFMVSVLAILFLCIPVLGAQATVKPIKIGIIGPMDIRTGNHLLISAQMAADEINAAGGVSVGGIKRPIELIKIPSNEYKKIADAVAAAERAITVDKVDFLIGGIIAEAISAIQDVAADHKIIYINTGFIVSRQYIHRMQKDYDRYKYCFAATPMEPADIAKAHIAIVDAVARAVRLQGVSKVRVARMVEKSVGGDAILGVTTMYFPKMGLEIVGTWRPSPTASDLRAETTAIKSSDPHIIYTVFSGPGGLVFGRQLEELKIPAIAAGSPTTAITPGHEIPYSIQMQPAASTPIRITDKNQAFYTEFIKRSGGERCVASTYDMVLNLAHNIEAVGSLDADALIKSMETLEHESISGPLTHDPKDHRVVLLRGYMPVYGAQFLPGGKSIIVSPVNAPVNAQPVHIPPWIIESWKMSGAETKR